MKITEQTITWEQRGTTRTVTVTRSSFEIAGVEYRLVTDPIPLKKAPAGVAGILMCISGRSKDFALTAESVTFLSQAQARVKALDEQEHGELYRQQDELLRLEAAVDRARDAAMSWQNKASGSDQDAATVQQTERQASQALLEAIQKYPEAWEDLQAMRRVE